MTIHQLPAIKPLDGELLSPNDGISTTIYKSPFSSKRTERVMPVGLTINEIVSDAIENPRLWKYTRVWVMNLEETEAWEAPRDQWDRIRLKPGTRLMIKVVPGGKGKSILGLILSLLILAAAWYLTPIIGGMIGVTSKIGLQLIFGTLSMLGKAAVAALIAPPKPASTGASGGNSTQRTFSLTGQSNRSAPFEAVPRVYGRMRIYPPIAGVPYNEIVGATDVYQRMLLDCGPGPLKLSDLKIGDTPLSNFKDVQVEVGHIGDLSGNQPPAGTYYAGFADDRALTLYPTDVAQTDESIKIDKGSNIIRSFAPLVDEGRVIINFPKGIQQVSNSESNPDARGPAYVVIQAHYREIGQSTWVPMIPSYLEGVVTTGGGRFVQLFDDRTGESGYSTHNVAQIWNDATYLAANADVNANYNPSGIGSVPRGLHHYANIGVLEGRAPAWVNGSTGAFIFSEMKEQLVFTQYKTAKLDRTKSYEFKINRVYGYQQSPVGKIAQVDEFWLSSIQSFKAVSPTKVTGHALVALRIRASEQLNGTLQTLSMVAEAILPEWNGSAWTTPAVTRSVQAAALDILRGTANLRPVSDSRLDLARWAALRTFCAGLNSKGNARAFFDGVFDARTTVLSALQAVLATARASFSMRDGKYSVIFDDTKSTPVQLFTPRNSRNFSAKKLYSNPPHATKVRYTNELKNHTEDELPVYDDGFNESNATVFEQVEAFGVTRAEQAFWFGRYLMAVNKLRPEVYTIEADIEGLVCRRGDLIRVQHDIPRWGSLAGRVRALQINAGNVETITIDGQVLVEEDKTYALRGRKADGTIILVPLSMGNVTLETNVLTLTTPLATASCVAIGDLVAYGESSAETVPLLVRGIRRLDDLACSLELVDYSPAIFTSDTESIPDFDTQSTWEGSGSVQAPPVPTIGQIVSDETVMQSTPTGYIEAVEIRLAQPTAAQRGQIRADDVIEVRYRRRRANPLDLGGIEMNAGEGTWFSPTTNFLGNPGTVVLTKYVRAGDELAFQVRRVTALGLPSDWSTEVFHTVVGRTTKPASVLAFTAQVRADDILLFWSPNQENDLDGYELRVGSSWETGTPVEAGKSPTTHTTQYVLPPLAAGSYNYRIKAVDSIGLLSDTDSVVNFTITAPAAPSGLAAAYNGADVVLTWNQAQGSHRTAHYKVQVGAAAAQISLTTTIKVPVNWSGTKQVKVWAVDLAGNEGAQASIDLTTVLAAAPSNFVSTLQGDNVLLTWNAATPGSLAIVHYELRQGGSDWDSATLVSLVQATTFSQRADFTGARTYRLAAIDAAGQRGAVSTVVATVSVPNSVAPTGGASGGVFSIAWPQPSSVLPIKEYEIRHGASFGAGTLVAVISALSYSAPVAWSGARQFWIVARTNTGLESAPAAITLTVDAPSAPAVASAFSGQNIVLTWTVPSASLAIARYEVRYGGSDWASATPLGFSDTTTFSVVGSWGGDRVFRVSAIDSAGNVGAMGVQTVTVNAPGPVTSLTAQVVDNNVLLKWSPPATGSLPIANYEVRRGATWAGGSSIGLKQGTFTSVFETASGSYTYWVAAYDTAGNVTATPVSITATVSQPPDYILVQDWNSTFPGTLTNAIKDGTAIVMPAITGRTFAEHFTDNSWDQPSDQISAGFPRYIQPTTTSNATYVEVFDYGASIPSANITVAAGFETIEGSITLTGKIEVSSDGSSYTPVADPGWSAFASTFRYVKVTVKAVGATNAAVGRLNTLNVRLDLKQITDAGGGACNSGDSGGTTFNFNKTFLDIVSIVVQPLGTTVIDWVVDFTDAPNPTSFKVLLFNSAGTRISGNIFWEARGV